MTRPRHWRVKPWSDYERPPGFPPAPALWDSTDGSHRYAFDSQAKAQQDCDRRNAKQRAAAA